MSAKPNKMFDNNIYFGKLHEKAVIPSKNKEDAGYDVYCAMDNEFIGIMPHRTEKIPTGLCSAFSHNMAVILKERSSVGSKGIGLRAGIIDSSYRGEWLVCLTNHNDVPFVIYDDKVYDSVQPLVKMFGASAIYYPMSKAVCQMLIQQVPHCKPTELDASEIAKFDSNRGTGGFGSTNK